MKNRILVVEDDAAIRDAVLLNLQFADYDAVAFDDGKKAADALESDHAYDLALLDIMLPGMDGFELFGLMEQYGIPVIYMTAKTDSASEIKGLRDGAEDYIVKPFDPLTLMVRIEKVLKRVGKWNAVYRVRDVVVNTETASGYVSVCVTGDGQRLRYGIDRGRPNIKIHCQGTMSGVSARPCAFVVEMPTAFMNGIGNGSGGAGCRGAVIGK